MSLIGIHESSQGSLIISIRAKEYIKNNEESSIDIGLGPDDIVTLQKKLEKKNDKGNKIKGQDQNKNGRSLSNEKPTKPYFDFNIIKKIPTCNKKEEKEEEDDQNINERLLLLNNNNKLYSHSPGGFNLNSQAAFPAYFSELLRRSTRTQKKTFWHALFRPRTNSCNNHLFRSSNGLTNTYNTSYDDSFVSKGCYYSYNIFTHKDVIVTVDNPGGCKTMMVNEKGEFENNLTNDDWRQVCLSSKLRFYRCSQPLLASFMFSKPAMTVCYYVYEVPYMNSDDFEYCMENYAHDPFSSNDDFEMSIAMSLIVNCDLKYALKFIEKYDSKFPRVLLHIIKHVAPSSRFCKMLIPVLSNHMMTFSDDIEVAVIFFDIALINMRIDICMSLLVPLLKGSIWANPQCGVSLAKFSIKNNQFEEALEFLNIACVVNAKKQKKFGFSNLSEVNEFIQRLPRSRSLSSSNKQLQNIPSFFRSTSMTLSVRKNVNTEKSHLHTVNNNHINSSNEYEYEIDNDNYNDDGSNLGLVFENNNDYYYKSLSSSQSSRFSSPHNSRKNSTLEDKNSNNLFEDDYESFSSSKPSSRLNSPRSQRKNSYTEGKNKSNMIVNDENEIFPTSKLNSAHLSRKNSYVEDNFGRFCYNNDFDNESFSSSRPSSRLSSGHSSRKNSSIEDTNINNQKPNFINSNNNGFSSFYFGCAQEMTSPRNSLEYGPSLSSCILLDNILTSIKSQILFTLSEFIDKLGEAEFDEKRNEFINERPIADEEEMLFDDESEIFTSYFCSPENDFIEEEEEFISTQDNEKFNETYNNSDAADTDNYDYANSNINDENNFNYVENTKYTPIIDKEVRFDNNNNNDSDDTTNKTDKDKDDDIPNIQLSQLRDKEGDANTNSICIPKFRHSAIVKENSNNTSNVKIQTNKANSHICFKINNGNNSNQNSRSIKTKIDLLSPNALFDPGIEAPFETISSLPIEIIHSMPASNFFLDCLSEIKKSYAESMLILAQQKDVTTSTQTSILFTALATNDTRLMEAMLNSFTEENRATGTDKLILLRGFTMNVTPNLEAILTVPLEPLTVIEKNALAFMEPFAIGIHRLNNTEL